MMNENEKEAEDWDAHVSGRVRIYVLNYCTSELYFMCQRAAYIDAFTKIKDGKKVYVPSNEVADANASRLMKKPEVRKAIVKLLTISQPEADQENSYRLLHDLVLQATYNPADIIDENGYLKVKKLKDLGDLAKCVRAIYMTKYGARVELVNKNFAQDKLLKYYDLVREVPEVQAQLPVIMLSDKQDFENWNKTEGDNAGKDTMEAAT